MKIILTGANGFIGSKLLTVLKLHDHEVIALDQQSNINLGSGNERFIQYNIAGKLPQEIFDFSPEILIHLAWEGIPDFSLEMCAKNVNEQVQFIDNIKKVPSIKKMIVTGTCMEYGRKTGICNESERNRPHSYFSWAKQTMSDFSREACAESSIKLIWFRLFYIYGLGQRPGSLIPMLFNAFQNNRNPTINNPSSSNDYVYINDVIDAIILAINNPELEGIFNLGSGSTTPIYKISKIIENLVCKTNAFSKTLESEAVNYPATPGFYADIMAAKSILGWNPKWNIEKGISDIYRSFPPI